MLSDLSVFWSLVAPWQENDLYDLFLCGLNSPMILLETLLNRVDYAPLHSIFVFLIVVLYIGFWYVSMRYNRLTDA